MKNTGRTRQIKTNELGCGPVLYIMARDQRVNDNWALLFAQDLAIKQDQPIIVACPLAVDYPNISKTQYNFMVEGLRQVEKKLTDKNIFLIASSNTANSSLLSLVESVNAGAIVTDFNPLKESVDWRTKIANSIRIPFYEVDTHNIVPCWIASDKQEYAAYTFRPKINRELNAYLISIPNLKKHPYSFEKRDVHFQKEWTEISNIASAQKSSRTFLFGEPGEAAAQEQLRIFLSGGLSNYNNHRNNPVESGQSCLSPYLHFGQLSAQRVALEAQKHNNDIASLEAFIEELIVRRELSDNYCFYNDNYDSFDGFPAWAQETLNNHRNDARSYLYDRDAFESADTHDDLWNAAQMEMILTGKMHGYMRMYWAKKILEWSISPEQALDNAIYLNDKYELDGFDPNGYAGIAWSIGGVHDRAWSERDIFGKVRYMNYNGCKRKFSIVEYIKRVDRLESESIA